MLVNRTWLTTDLHFNHDAMVMLCDRPKNFKERIIKHWLRQIKPEDTVICLGDLCIGDDLGVAAIIASLPGRKFLVKGNHDKKSDTWYETLGGWNLCCEALLLKRYGHRILLTHRPATVGDHYDINIHGHQHNVLGKDIYGTNHLTGDGKRFLLAQEYEMYQPVLLDSFVHRCEKIAPQLKKATA